MLHFWNSFFTIRKAWFISKTSYRKGIVRTSRSIRFFYCPLARRHPHITHGISQMGDILHFGKQLGNSYIPYILYYMHVLYIILYYRCQVGCACRQVKCRQWKYVHIRNIIILYIICKSQGREDERSHDNKVRIFLRNSKYQNTCPSCLDTSTMHKPEIVNRLLRTCPAGRDDLWWPDKGFCALVTIKFWKLDDAQLAYCSHIHIILYIYV